MKTEETTQIQTEANELENYWKERNVRILEDRDIINLVKQPLQEGEKNWVSNEPKTFYDTAKSLISSYPPRVRMPLSMNYDPEEKDKISKTERLALGIFRQINDRRMGIGESFWLRDLAHWILSGYYNVFSWVKKTGDEVYFMADLWDPLTCYPWWDNEKMVRFARSYECDKTTAMGLVDSWKGSGLKFDFKFPLNQEHVKLINYWRDNSYVKNGKLTHQIKNAILMGDVVIKPLTLHKQFSRIPIFSGTVGIPEKSASNWQSLNGENIIAADRDMYDYTNTIFKLWAEITAAMAWPNIVTTSQSGKPVIKPEQAKGHGSIMAKRHGELIELLKTASTPSEARDLMAVINQWKQKGALPDIVYGGVPVELSGFAISQLMAAIKYKMAPYLVTMQYVVAQVLTELLMQYKRGKFSKISLTTVDVKSPKKDQKFFVEDYSATDVPDRVFMEVTIPVTSPLDKTQQIIFARQALTEPQLLSMETIWDEILEVQDSEQEYERISQDRMLRDPIVQQIAIIEQLRLREEMYRGIGKGIEADALHRYILQLEMQIGMRQGIPQTSSGIPPNVMPPEAMQSPDMTSAALNLTPGGINRRPQTPEERASSQGRKGVLVSPSGETLL